MDIVAPPGRAAGFAAALSQRRPRDGEGSAAAPDATDTRLGHRPCVRGPAWQRRRQRPARLRNQHRHGRGVELDGGPGGTGGPCVSGPRPAEQDRVAGGRAGPDPAAPRCRAPPQAKRAAVFFGWVFFLISLRGQAPHVPGAHMWALNACGEPTEIELTATHGLFHRKKKQKNPPARFQARGRTWRGLNTSASAAWTSTPPPRMAWRRP